MNKVSILILILFTSLLFACKQGNSDRKSEEQPKVESIKLFAQARPGGEHFDFDMPIDKGLDDLEFADQATIDIDSNELIIGVSLADEQLAIPIKYLSGFEVANLSVKDENYLVTWCPLVGSARIFEGEIGGDHSGFDFGRGLIDNNLLIIDRKTHSVWNQLSCKSVKGDLEGERLNPIATVQSTWSFWVNKYPNTKILINRDTSDAVFPQFVYQKPYYNTWIPGEKYPESDGSHKIKNIGLGIELQDSSAFFSFEKLFQETSPISYTMNNQELNIHFDQNGLTAWVTKSRGEMIPSTVVYNWAWHNFFPESRRY